jgi:hypothetical protein
LKRKKPGWEVMVEETIKQAIDHAIKTLKAIAAETKAKRKAKK